MDSLSWLVKVNFFLLAPILLANNESILDCFNSIHLFALSYCKGPLNHWEVTLLYYIIIIIIIIIIMIMIIIIFVAILTSYQSLQF